MPRSRNIKPGLFKNEILGDADPIYSLLFVGLWTLADKEGRLENRPKKIKAEIFPYRFDLDLSMALAWLMDESFITEYGIDGKSYFQVNNWHKHQSPHHKEVKSEIPSIEQVEKLNENQRLADAQLKHDSSMDHGQLKESASSPLIPDSLNLIPDSLIPDSLIPEVISSRGVNYTEQFELFWQAYPNDRRGNKKRAFVNWKKIPSEMYALITDHVKRRVVEAADWSSPKDRGYIIQAEGFLSGERWEDSWIPVVDYSETTRGNIERIRNMGDLNG